MKANESGAQLLPAVLWEGQGLLALAKPAGQHVFGLGSICEWLMVERPELAGIGPPAGGAIVHRLDRDTSGLLLAATSPEDYDRLRAVFGQGLVDKTYLALVEGELDRPLVVELGLGGRYRHSKKVLVDDGTRKLRGVRPARTEVEPLARGGGLSLCRVGIRSGMRHQIRAHLAHLGHPLGGDRLYGASRPWPARRLVPLGLHAWCARVPVEKQLLPLKLCCPPPAPFADLLRDLGMAENLLVQVD